MGIWWKDGFYDHPVDGGVSITKRLWNKLLAGQAAGKRIVTGSDGAPRLEDYPEPDERKVAEERIEELKRYLDTTDWVVIKCLETGVPCSDQYADIQTRRAAARAEINTLQEHLAELE